MIYYFDNCATTQVDENIVQILAKYHTERYFNPSARSSFSLQVANDIAISREQIAKALGCATNEIVFTGGGTEADNLAIFGSLRAKRGNIVITQAEHAATYNPVAELNNRGYEVRYANVLPDGHIDVEDFVSKVNSETLLACFVHVNNETGAVNDVCNINKLVKSRNPQTITFSDGIQAVGKILVNLRHLGVDLYSFAGHKIHCTKGIGALYIKQGVRIVPNVFGGGQEKGLRSGTEYVGGIVALASAVNTALKNLSSNTSNFEQYKQTILFALRDIPDWKQICSREASPAILTLAFANLKGEVLLHMLESNNIVVGTGSACSSKNKQSRVARAIGLDGNYSEGVLRISFSKYNTSEQVQLLADKLAECVTQLRKIMLGK